MNKNSLQRLRRRDLLEMLLELSKENEQLKERVSDLEAQLQERTIQISEAGSLAEAALQLNGVFRAAQEACDQYTYNTQRRCQRMEELTRNKCIQMLGEAKKRMDKYETEDCE